jgi:hypothetical protein
MVVPRMSFRFPVLSFENFDWNVFSPLFLSFSHGISVSDTLNFPVTFNPTAMTINVRIFLFAVRVQHH